MLCMTAVPLQPLPRQGVLLLEGTNAAAFLHGQVTADILSLAAGHATLAALCSPQGRVIAVARIGRIARGLVMLLPRELAAPVADRLRHYVLRAGVSVSDVSDDLAVAGLMAGDGPPVTPPGDWQPLQLSHGRILAIGPVAARAQPPATGAPAGSWDASCVALGEPEVYAATRETWVPQMLNLDLVGAVSLTKGCYTGQEVVARVQHLGRIKRRMFRYRFAGVAGLAVGSALLHGDTEVAKVVRVTGGPEEGELLAVLGIESAGLSLTDAQRQVTCTPIPMPYPVPEAANTGDR
jgi:folate-binding protein YgfZ